VNDRHHRFIATDFALHAPEPAVPAERPAFPTPPTLLTEDAQSRFWFKLDTTFLKPKVNVLIDIVTPVVSFVFSFFCISLF
jgi:hypothetical protein